MKEPPLKISGDADRYSHRVGNDDFSQPRALFDQVHHDYGAGVRAALKRYVSSPQAAE